ncbi:TetR/AcrR family transcriptional regulator [Rhodococcus opacus]|nr:TetR/AcrR family transcriptional regulator [Rhodococcus opacus]
MNGGESARSRLLQTAARLFAEQGVGVVSLREITREAGVKHATAVQYHFGDRHGLLDAVLEGHFKAVEDRRTLMLDQADETGIAELRQLAEILVRPLAAELADEPGRFFLRIYGQMLSPATEKFVDDGSSMWRWRDAAAPFLPAYAHKLHPRFTAVSYATAALASKAVDDKRSNDRLFVSRLIDVVTAIITAPVSDETAQLLAERSILH